MRHGTIFYLPHHTRLDGCCAVPPAGDAEAAGKLDAAMRNFRQMKGQGKGRCHGKGGHKGDGKGKGERRCAMDFVADKVESLIHN